MNPAWSCALFDLDNTLTDRAATIELFSERFLAGFRDQLQPGVTLDDVERVVTTGDGGGYRPKDMMFQEIQSDLDWLAAPSVETLAEYWYRMSAACMQLREGALDTLAALRDRGYMLGMITNGKTRVQNATIDAVGVRDFFSIILVSETVGVRKPDPRIFQAALDALRVVPQAAVFIGDHPEADVDGAHKAGLGAIWLAGLHPWQEALPPAEYQIDHLRQLLAILT